MIEDITGIVLAGGRSVRFGSDKALAAWDGRTLLAAAAERLLETLGEVIVVAKPDQDRPLPPRVRRAYDSRPFQHPLVGVHAGLAACRTPWAFVCACDMPFVSPSLIRDLAQLRSTNEAVLPLWQGMPQPLCGLYARSSLPVLERWLEAPGSVMDFVGSLKVAWLEEPPQCFVDIDDVPAYREALARIR